MRFDEFVATHGVATSPTERFAGLVVEVEAPPDWELFDSALGVRVWVRRDDPCIEQFCANAVLTMHRLQVALDAGEVFAMLTEQQLRTVPGSRELHRELAAADGGVGMAGVLFMQINDQPGTIDSISRCRIITTERETLIAQLTVTALHESPVDRAHVRLTVRAGAVADSTSAGQVGGAPVARLGDGR